MGAHPTNSLDVLIIGGGVAGSSLATVLARAGLGVAVVEREARFRDKVKGEGIHPWGYREVKSLGLTEALFSAGANELPIWQLYSDRVPDEPFLWESDPANPLPEVTVAHPALQDALISAAANAGAVVYRPARAILIPGSDPPEVEVLVGDRTTRLSPRLIVGADGRNSIVRRWMGAALDRDPAHHWLAGALFDRISLDEGKTHGASFEGGRTFVFPQGHGIARAYVVASNELANGIDGLERAKRVVEICSAALPEGAFENARSIGPVAKIQNNDVWPREIAKPPFVLIGDAAGANDPSVGQGLSLVFRDVRELRDLLLDGDDWARSIHEFARRRRAYFEVLRVHARWTGILTVEVGPEADRRREQVDRAREQDQTAGGFSMIFSRGPDGLEITEEARRHYFGEDLAGS
jgi:2-polyprenyl-6-methoxyphenol hydroxylase-like FAD-dependent oxidoreductase